MGPDCAGYAINISVDKVAWATVLMWPLLISFLSLLRAQTMQHRAVTGPVMKGSGRKVTQGPPVLLKRKEQTAVLNEM